MDYKLGNICHIEIPAGDLGKSKEFYGTLFNWTFQPMNETYEFFNDGVNGGALDTDARPSRDGAILVLYCEDIDAKLGEIEKAGGKTVKGKTQIPGHGAHYAYFEDPAGNRMGLYAPAK
ncbi:MAG: VOC family protein [Planctomycetes bacterium]|nr:VOC family protein [Planctomycetota bacterium]